MAGGHLLLYFFLVVAALAEDPETKPKKQRVEVYMIQQCLTDETNYFNVDIDTRRLEGSLTVTKAITDLKVSAKFLQCQVDIEVAFTKVDLEVICEDETLVVNYTDFCDHIKDDGLDYSIITQSIADLDNCTIPEGTYEMKGKQVVNFDSFLKKNLSEGEYVYELKFTDKNKEIGCINTYFVLHSGDQIIVDPVEIN